MSGATEASTIGALALASAVPSPIEPGKVYSVIVPAGAEQVDIDLTGSEFVERPSRARGKVAVHSAESLIAFLGKHGLPESEVWADRINHRIVAVVNAGQGSDGAPGWGDHLAVFNVQLTTAWQAWIRHDGKWLGQTEFAEHIEDRLLDIVKPTGAEMLEIAQSFHASTGAKFESSHRLSSGEGQLEYRETIEATAGKAGRLTIPSHIELGLKPFEGAPAYKVTARFRYRINGGSLRLAYALERPDEVINEAFDAVVSKVQEAVTQPVFFGAP
jgi:uncharacterized protein YfdQ (DUF2303 family)